MARNMVTRTIKATKVNALCLDLISAEPYNEEITIAGVFKDKAKLKKYLDKNYNTEQKVVASIVDFETIDTLYGMTEQKFMENAEVLPPRKAND